jgi:hypothetical protein
VVTKVLNAVSVSTTLVYQASTPPHKAGKNAASIQPFNRTQPILTPIMLAASGSSRTALSALPRRERDIHNTLAIASNITAIIKKKAFKGSARLPSCRPKLPPVHSSGRLAIINRQMAASAKLTIAK